MVLVDYKKLLNIFEHYEDDLYGSQGFCLIKDNLIKKIYFKPSKLIYDFTEFKSDMIAFPIEYMCDKNDSNMIVGEIMPYYNCQSITWAFNKDVLISNLIFHFSKMIEEIKKYKEIRMLDLCRPNI